jgi:hypothetical protein
MFEIEGSIRDGNMDTTQVFHVRDYKKASLDISLAKKLL